MTELHEANLIQLGILTIMIISLVIALVKWISIKNKNQYENIMNVIDEKLNFDKAIPSALEKHLEQKIKNNCINNPIHAATNSKVKGLDRQMLAVSTDVKSLYGSINTIRSEAAVDRTEIKLLAQKLDVLADKTDQSNSLLNTLVEHITKFTRDRNEY